jgi:hypothetical protein
MFRWSLSGVVSVLKSKPSREERERLFAESLAAYEDGRMTLTEARIAAGLASWRARLAYRFPRLFGRLCTASAADRVRPVYAPKGGWRFSDAGARLPRASSRRWSRHPED